MVTHLVTDLGSYDLCSSRYSTLYIELIYVIKKYFCSCFKYE